MSILSKEQLTELTERINERIAEWEFPRNFSGFIEKLPPGVVRLVFDAINEWATKEDVATLKAQLEADAAAYERGRADMRYELELQRARADELTDDEKRKLRAIAAEVEKIHAGSITDADQIRVDLRAHTAYPSLDGEPNGVDVFAGVHPVAGAPELNGIDETPTAMDAETLHLTKGNVTVMFEMADDPPPMPAPTNGHDAYELSTASVVTLGASHTGGNGHTEPSPAAIATLGPAHTMVTPLVPRRLTHCPRWLISG